MRARDITYAGHELEDRGLGLFKQFYNLLEARSHRVLVRISPDHAAVQTIAKSVINVEL